MRDPCPEGVRRSLEACREQSARDVLSSDAWVNLWKHCGDLTVELDALGHHTIAQRVDRDYARLHAQLREATAANPPSNRFLLADAINELSSTLAAIQRFQAAIVAARAVPAEHRSGGPTAKPAAGGDHEVQSGGPEPDPQDARMVVWIGKHIRVGDDTQVSRLFWLLTKPVGAARTLGEVQRAIDGMETDRDGDPDEVKRADQQARKVVSKLRAALRDANMDDHVVIVRGGTREVPEYTMVWRFAR